MKILRTHCYLFFLLFICAIVLSGCANKSVLSDGERETKAFSFMNTRSFQQGNMYNYKITDPLPFSEIVGISADENRVYYLDKSLNCVHITDNTGRLLGRFGTVGNSLGELLKPTTLVVSAGRIHIADNGNRRIQVFDNTGNAVDTFSLSFLPEYAECASIACIEDGYLISVESRENDTTVYYAKDKNTIVELSNRTRGIVTSDGDSGYFVESSEFYKVKTGYGFRTGENAVYQLKDSRLNRLANNFPYGYSIARTAYFYQGRWYALSPSYMSIDRFDKQWNYEESILNLSKVIDKSGDLYGTLFAMNSLGQMYVFMPETKQLVVFTPSNG